jgi:NAD(P)-dependent dehydrogenase (short-subunit alcohol dehydrogenase family)
MTGGIALVTGAGSGVGRAAALALVAAGYQVVLTGRRQAALEETKVVASGPGESHVMPCDVTDPEAVGRLFREIAQRFKRLDVVFNNAGSFSPATNFGDLDFATWRHVLSVNLDGAFLIAQGAFALMKRQRPQGGRIINNGSISAHVPRPGSAAYTASKHAITGLTRSISLDGRAFNIACGQIDIGNAFTEMTAAISKGALQADGSLRPEPTMDARHVGEAVAHMASLPLTANVQFITIMATNMPFIGRG